MASENKQPYLSDGSNPNAGRIYDYFLGGDHYFEVDKEAAEQIIKMAPFAPKLARLIRWFLGTGIRKALKWGFTRFIDFASGLPVEDHIHVIAPAGTKVIYSDIDPVTVRYGNKIIGNNSIVKYESCNAGNPEILLESDIVKEVIGNDHKCAIGFNGISYFLTDDQISHAMKVLYEWADEGAIIYLTGHDAAHMTDEFLAVFKIYENMSQAGESRSKAQFEELIKPWKIKEPGFLLLEDWQSFDREVTDDILKLWGGGGFFGGFLEK